MSRAKKAPRRKTTAKKGPTPPKPKAPAKTAEPEQPSPTEQLRTMRVVPHDVLQAAVDLLQTASHAAPYNQVSAVLNRCVRCPTVGEVADQNGLAIEPKEAAAAE